MSLPLAPEFEMTPESSSPEYQHAEELSRSRQLQLAFLEAMQDQDSWTRAQRSPEEWLRAHGVELPGSLSVRFLDGPELGRPVPEFEAFNIVLKNCRTVWLKKIEEAGYEEVTICFGIEITPNVSPRDPLA